MGQQSIMSSEFEDQAVDSLVKVKTQRLRPRKAKVIIKSYKHFDSYLIVNKDSFAFLDNIKTKAFSTVNFDKFISENDSLSVVYNTNPQITKQDTLNTESFISLSKIQNDTAYHTQIDTPVLEAVPLPITEAKTTAKSTTIESTVQRPDSTKATNSLSGDLWLMVLLLSVLLLFAFVKVYFKSKIKIYSQAIVSYQSFNKMYKEQNTIHVKLALLLSLIYNINFSLILYYSLIKFIPLNHQDPGLFLFLGILGFVIAFTLFLISLNKLLSFFFEVHQLIKEIIYNYLFTNRILGLLLLPIVLTYPYLPEFLANILLFSTWGILAFSFIFRWFRAFIISFKYRVSYFYMILYLCVLEIIPLIFFTREALSLY